MDSLGLDEGLWRRAWIPDGACRSYLRGLAVAGRMAKKRRNHSMKRRHRPTVPVIGADDSEGLQPRPRTLNNHIQELAQP
ncbi:hypothetical protein [Variovorax boronicumulans]|uniref:hypothetical protein n=1 Tax=Variovorax boronicumulans TaxID=436515 RepID=UPI001112CBC3|nr:hypothetical protein [Variovorax boronicumulans]